MASSSGINVNNEGKSGRETRQGSRKIDSYAKPIISKPQPSLTFQEWPENEKEALLLAMKKYGHYDIENLCKAVPGKSKENIKLVINMWWKSARMAMLASAKGNISIDGSPTPKRGRKPTTKYPMSTDKVPLDQWLFKLENNQAAGGCTQTKLLAKVFLYISKYEAHPPPEDCNGVDFKALYEFLYSMLNGYPGKDLNAQTSTFLLSSLNEMASLIRERGMVKEIAILERTQRVTGDTKVLRQYSGKKKKLEHVVEPSLEEMQFKKLLGIPGFNPLNISADILKK